MLGLAITDVEKTGQGVKTKNAAARGKPAGPGGKDRQLGNPRSGSRERCHGKTH